MIPLLRLKLRLFLKPQHTLLIRFSLISRHLLRRSNRHHNLLRTGMALHSMRRQLLHKLERVGVLRKLRVLLAVASHHFFQVLLVLLNGGGNLVP